MSDIVERLAASLGNEYTYDPDKDEAIAEIERLRRELADANQTIDFVVRWAWREDPPHASRKLTDGERLSAIKYHPTIKAIWHPPSPKQAAVSEGGEDE